jgi:hypothetical protein
MIKNVSAQTVVALALVGAVSQAEAQLRPRAPASAQVQSSETNWLKGETTRGLQVSGVASGASSATIGYVHFTQNPNVSYRFDAGINFTKPGEGDNQFSFSADFGYRTYVAQSGSIKAFTQPGFFLAKASTPADLADELTVAVQYLVGAEYFVNPNFSLGASGGAALTFSDKFKQISLGTGTSALFAALYW